MSTWTLRPLPDETPGFALHRPDGRRVTDRVFGTLTAGRTYAAAHYGALPALRMPNAQPFDPARQPLHAALQRIERAFNVMNTIVMVTATHYYVRRSRLGVEVPVRYWCSNGIVKARKLRSPLL